MNESLACVITFSSGSMLRLENKGAVCAVYDEFVIILMAFFCGRNILLMFVCEVQLYMLVQYSM
jgi:hypothetical protein